MLFEVVLFIIALGLGFSLGWYIFVYRGGRKKERLASFWQSRAYVKGVNYMLANQPDEAIAELTKAVKLNPETAEIYLSLGNLFREKGEVERAIRIHQSIIIRPTLEEEVRIQALLALGQDYQKAGFLDRAIQTYREVIQRDAKNLLAHRQLEKLYEEERNWEQAYATWRKIQRLTKSKDNRVLANLQVELAKDFHQRGEVKQALRQLKTAIYLDSGCTRAYLCQGEIYQGMGKLRQAVEVWEQAVKKHLRFCQLLYRRLEEAYLAQGCYGQIANLFRRVLEQHPDDVRTHLALSEFYRRQGELDAALEEIRVALGYVPENNLLRQLYLQLICEAKDKAAAKEASQLLGEIAWEQIPYRCSICGYETTDSPWKCIRCREWDTFEDSLEIAKEE